LDWNTIELTIDPRVTTAQKPESDSTIVYFPRRGLSMIRQILSGASTKARAAGAVRTHAQICRLLDPGLEILAYGWGLVAAAMANDLPVSVNIAAYVICETSARLVASVARA
jgi:hypothetical protein